MVIGVILVHVLPGFERSVFEMLRSTTGLRELYHLFGKYDFLVIVEVEDLPRLSKMVDNIRAIDGVATTHTIVGAEVQGA